MIYSKLYAEVTDSISKIPKIESTVFVYKNGTVLFVFWNMCD